MASAEIDEPPSPSKLDLIRRFLQATGIQERIDTGSFLQRFAMPGTPLFTRLSNGGAAPVDAVMQGTQTLEAAYTCHRQIWQDEYEAHINWEFAETELQIMVAFLEAPEGQHFLEGRWRMDAYIATNTEDLVEQIIAEAERATPAPD
jgi:hypothetical protein